MVTEVFMTHEVQSKLFAYANIAKTTLSSEIGGYLVADELDEGGLLINDVILPDQEVSGAFFEAKPGGSWVKEKGHLSPKIRGWWHSHQTMGTFHSGTDDNTLGDKFDGETKNSPNYAISIVVSLPFDMKCYMQYFKPVKTNKFECIINVLHPPEDAMIKACEEEVKKCVKKKTYAAYTPPYSYNNMDLEPWKKGELNSKPTPSTTKRKPESKEDMELRMMAEDMVIDPVTGYSVTELREAEYLNEDYDKDLLRQVDELIRILKEKGSLKDFRFGCDHLFVDETKFKTMCDINGETLNCCTCQMKNISKKTETSDPKSDTALPLS